MELLSKIVGIIVLICFSSVIVISIIFCVKYTIADVKNDDEDEDEDL